MIIRPIILQDRSWINKYLIKEWASTNIVSREKIYDTKILPGFIALENNQYIGILTYRIERDECEIMTLNSIKEGIGIGSALLKHLLIFIKQENIKRVWLITTNNNWGAFRFYQKKGFVIKTIYPNAIEKSRQLKPQIPLVDSEGIPIRDEIELELKTQLID